MKMPPMSVLHVVKKRKSKSRVLGQVEVARRANFDGLNWEAKVEFIRNLAQMGMFARPGVVG